MYRKLGTRVEQRTNPSATYTGFGLSRRSSSKNYRLSLEQCQRRQEALELDHVDTNVQRKRSKDQDISNHMYTCWDVQARHVDTNVAIAYSVDTLTVGGQN
jgi:hypothetical protein